MTFLIAATSKTLNIVCPLLMIIKRGQNIHKILCLTICVEYCIVKTAFHSHRIFMNAQVYPSWVDRTLIYFLENKVNTCNNQTRHLAKNAEAASGGWTQRRDRTPGKVQINKFLVALAKHVSYIVQTPWGEFCDRQGGMINSCVQDRWGDHAHH